MISEWLARLAARRDLTREEAEAEANRIVPELFRIAEALGEIAPGRDISH